MDVGFVVTMDLIKAYVLMVGKRCSDRTFWISA